VHNCPECSFTTDRDVGSGQVIRNRGVTLISTDGQSGIESVCAVDLPGVEVTQPLQVAKPRKRKICGAGFPPQSFVREKNQKI